MNKEYIYNKLPKFLQLLALNIEGIRINLRRFGGSYKSLEQEVFRRRKFNSGELKKFQNKMLKLHFESASLTPYWKDIFIQHNVNIESDDLFKQLSKLPILKKSAVIQNSKGIENRKSKTKVIIERATSGTTGSGLRFIESLYCEQSSWATWWRYRTIHGIKKSTMCGYFGGRKIVSLSQKKPPYWKYNLISNQIMFSNYHLSISTAQFYINKLLVSKVEWLHGYPSFISLLASLSLELEIPVMKSIKWITFGAENLNEFQVKNIKLFFPNASLSEHYGQAESVVNISECEFGTLHVDEDFSIAEFIEVEKGSKEHHIIGTNFSNYAYPLFRYDTGDIATLSDSQCACGSYWRAIEKIDGRLEDYVWLPSGVKIGRLDHIFKDIENIMEAQIIQNSQEQLDVNIVKSSSFGEKDHRLLSESLNKYIGNEIIIQINFCDSLVKTKSGKLRLVLSNI